MQRYAPNRPASLQQMTAWPRVPRPALTGVAKSWGCRQSEKGILSGVPWADVEGGGLTAGHCERGFHGLLRESCECPLLPGSKASLLPHTAGGVQPGFALGHLTASKGEIPCCRFWVKVSGASTKGTGKGRGNRSVPPGGGPKGNKAAVHRGYGKGGEAAVGVVQHVSGGGVLGSAAYPPLRHARLSPPVEWLSCWNRWMECGP